MTDPTTNALLALAGAAVARLRLEYDCDYGVDRRAGWSVSVDGVVCVQFAPSPADALRQAARYVAVRDSPENAAGRPTAEEVRASLGR